MDLYRTVGDRGNEAATLSSIGSVYRGVGQPQQALDHYQQALPIHRDVGNRAGEAATLNNIAVVQFQRGELAEAREALVEVIGIFQAVGNLRAEAQVGFNMAVLLERMGRVGEATRYQRRAVELAIQTEHPGLERMRAFLAKLETNREE